MSRFAIIIGVDHYENPAWRLAAAVDDALAFREWALGPGGVPPENVHLLLSPEPGREPGVPYEPADSDHIIDLIHQFQRGRGADGERLYFYYAGHGTAAPGARDEVSILPSDVRAFPRDARRIIGFSELLPPLQECGPASQFFFVDACRDLLLEDFTRGAAPAVGRWRGPPVLEAPQRRAQYLLYATSPGGRALETSQGVFGRLLLQGLKGHPGALVWSQRELRYELRFSQLAEFVRTEVETQVKRLGSGWRQFLQLPEQDVPPGSSGQRDFVLERFTSEQVGKLPLRVRVNPGAVRQTCDVAVLYYAPGGFEVPIQTVKPVPPAPLPFPVELQLPPGDYTLLAQAKEHEAIRQPCALYRPQTVEFELKREALSGFLNGTAYLEPFSRDPQNPRGHGIALPEVLTVRSDDPHAWIVLVDPSREERMGFGQLTVPNPSAGIYRARFMLPEGPSPEQNFEVRHGGPDTFILKALPPPMGPMQRNDLPSHGLRSNARGYFTPVREGGPVAQLRLASMLGFAAATASRREESLESILWVLLGASGEQPVPGTPVPEFLAQSRLVLRNAQPGHIAQESSFQLLPTLRCAATWKQPVSASSWVLELSLPQLAPTRYALTTLPDRRTLLIVVADDTGEVEVQQYWVRPPPGAELHFSLHEPHGSTALRLQDLRHLELGQRYLAAGAAVPWHHLKPVLEGRCLDPMMGCIAGYALVREGSQQLQKHFTESKHHGSNLLQGLLHAFDALPDVHVLAGLCEPEHQQAHFQRALERGLPVFSDGLRILQRHTDGAGNPWFAEANRGLIPGSLWTSWIVR